MEKEELEELINTYAQESVDSMDIDCMMEVIMDLIETRMLEMSEEDVVSEISDLAPHLLGE